MTEAHEKIPNDLKRRFNKWKEQYRIGKLESMSPSAIKSLSLKFDNEVARVRMEYNRGDHFTPELARIVGENPYTHQQLELIRNRIGEEADAVRTNIKIAQGRAKDREKNRRQQMVAEVKEILLATLLIIRRLRF